MLCCSHNSHYFTPFQSELITNLRAPFKEHQTLTLQCDYKWSTFNYLPCTSKFIFLINYILHTLSIRRLCTQVSCWITGRTFGQSKRPNHFLRNSFAVISLPLLPPLCFHMCFRNLVEHFPCPITIRRGKENPALTPPETVCAEKENGRQIEMISMLIIIVCLQYYNATVAFFLLRKRPCFLLAALASLRQSLANKAPWNWKVNWNWMEGGHSLSLSFHSW